MKTIDGQRISLKGYRMEDGREVLRAVAGGAVLWAQDFPAGTKVREMRADAVRALEEMGVVNDE